MGYIFFAVGTLFILWLWRRLYSLTDFQKGFDELSEQALAAQKDIREVAKNSEERLNEAEEISLLFADMTARLKPVLSNLPIYRNPAEWTPMHAGPTLVLGADSLHRVCWYSRQDGFKCSITGEQIEPIIWASLPDQEFSNVCVEALGNLNDIAIRVNSAFKIDIGEIAKAYQDKQR